MLLLSEKKIFKKSIGASFLCASFSLGTYAGFGMQSDFAGQAAQDECSSSSDETPAQCTTQTFQSAPKCDDSSSSSSNESPAQCDQNTSQDQLAPKEECTSSSSDSSDDSSSSSTTTDGSSTSSDTTTSESESSGTKGKLLGVMANAGMEAGGILAEGKLGKKLSGQEVRVNYTNQEFSGRAFTQAELNHSYRKSLSFRGATFNNGTSFRSKHGLRYARFTEANIYGDTILLGKFNKRLFDGARYVDANGTNYALTSKYSRKVHHHYHGKFKQDTTMAEIFATVPFEAKKVKKHHIRRYKNKK